MEWELSKENVQPTKSGRNVEVLNDALKAQGDGPARSGIFERQRRQLLDDIDCYVGNDPLTPWIRCIKWVNDAFPAGGAQSELSKLLEKCTRKFQKDERYRRDVRYLRVWVQYADCCSDPSDIFAFLEINEIGQDHALFYEAYATTMEVRRNFSKADEVYQLGLQRCAQPLGRLENMYRNFLKRMYRRGERKMQEEQQRVASGFDQNNVQVREFGPSAMFPEPVGQQQAGRQRPRQPPLPVPHARASRPENTKFPVVVDPEFQGLPKITPQDLDARGLLLPENQPTWCHLPNDMDKIKENVQQPTKWSDVKIGQRSEFQPSKQPELNILVDEEFAEGSSQKPHLYSSKNNTPSLRLRLEDMQNTRRRATGLKGSFLNFTEANVPLSTVETVKPQTGVTSLQGASVRRSPGETVLGYDTTLLTENGMERSFEELRLSIWTTQHVGDEEEWAKLSRNSGSQEKSDDVLGSLPSRVNEDFGLVTESAEVGSITRDVTDQAELSSSSPSKVDDQTDFGSREGPSSPSFRQEDYSNRPACSSGLNVYNHLSTESGANDEVMTDFHLPSQGAVLPSALSEMSSIQFQNASASFPLGDETVAIKRFAEEVIVLGSDPKVNTIETVNHHGLVDQTINTKEALADILDMFNKPLECDNAKPKTRIPKDVKKRTSKPLVKSSGFQIFVDDSLDLQSPAKLNKNEKGSKASFGKPTADPIVQKGGFHIFADENLDVKKPPHAQKDCRKSQGNKSGSPFDPLSQSAGFHIFNDENLEDQIPDDFEKNWKIDQSSMNQFCGGQSRGLDIFHDQDLDVQNSTNTDKGETEACKVSNHVPHISTYQIFDDKDPSMERHNQKCDGQKMTEISPKKPAPQPDISVEDLHELSLNSHQLDEKSVRCQPEDNKSADIDYELTDSAVREAGSSEDVLCVEITFGEKLSPTKMNLCELSKPEQSNSSPSDSSLHTCVSERLAIEDAAEGMETREVTSLGNLETAPVMENPWDESNIQALVTSLRSQFLAYDGFFESKQKYCGTIPISALKNARNKILELDNNTYHLKKCIGQGAFAQVFEAEDEEDDCIDDAPKLALKFQKPACPWEFYIYRQLDLRISHGDRHYYGHARRFHLYSDSSFMVCDYGGKGTLQDVINAYLASGRKMDEVLCIFYAIEMLHMLEVLHRVGIIHGDFKPDNLLIRDDGDGLVTWAPNRPGCWKSQGLSLIDWGRSIDISLYPSRTEFIGDCKTDSFRCPEMLENRPWTFQVDTFGLCSVLHCLLHGNYMQIEKVQTANAKTIYRPKSPYKRFWNIDLWRNFFETLLNVRSCVDNPSLSALRQAFEYHLTDNALEKKLKDQLAKQRIMMFTRW